MIGIEQWQLHHAITLSPHGPNTNTAAMCGYIIFATTTVCLDSCKRIATKQDTNQILYWFDLECDTSQLQWVDLELLYVGIQASSWHSRLGEALAHR